MSIALPSLEELGTIPSKTLRETVMALRGLSRRSAGAVTAPLEEGTEVSALMTRLEDAVTGHEEYIAAQLRRNDVAIARAHASFVTPHELALRAQNGEQRRVTAQYVILAVGSRPREPKGVPVDHERVLELVHVGQMAILAGFDVDMLIEATFNFPTLAEGYRVAALDVVERRG